MFPRGLSRGICLALVPGYDFRMIPKWSGIPNNQEILGQGDPLDPVNSGSLLKAFSM